MTAWSSTVAAGRAWEHVRFSVWPLAFLLEGVEVPLQANHDVAGEVVETAVDNGVCSHGAADVFLLSEEVVGSDGESKRLVG